jgi:hypothetical protein
MRRATVFAAAGILAAAAALAAQGPSGKIPRTAAGKPDFTGFWEHPQRPGAPFGATVFDRSKMAPFVPGGEALFYEPRTGDPRHDEPRAFCMPSGFPSNLFGPYPVQMVQSPDWLVMVHEYDRMTRLIPLDGRPHREVDPTFYGDPVGRWEGDTLVIESRNFKRWSLDDYYYQNAKEYRMHTEALRTIERLRFRDATTLDYQITIDDPKIFVRPWSEDFVMRSRPEWEKVGLYEFVCQENNRCPGGNCRDSGPASK